MHDDVRRPADAPFRHPGTGTAQLFRCCECNLPRVMTGRRLVRVRSGSMKGARAMVCAECLQAREQR